MLTLSLSINLGLGFSATSFWSNEKGTSSLIDFVQDSGDDFDFELVPDLIVESSKELLKGKTIHYVITIRYLAAHFNT